MADELTERPRLDRAAVASAALELLDEVGLDGLSVRRLATVLGVKSPALYWHFRDKAELLDLMAQELLRPVTSTRSHKSQIRPDRGWQEWAAHHARQRRHALLARRDGARLVVGTRPGPEIARRAEADLQILLEAGFSHVDGLRVMLALGHYVTGFVIEEQAAAQRAPTVAAAGDLRAQTPTLAAALAEGGPPESDDAFEDGLAALLIGLEATRKKRSALRHPADDDAADVAPR